MTRDAEATAAELLGFVDGSLLARPEAIRSTPETRAIRSEYRRDYLRGFIRARTTFAEDDLSLPEWVNEGGEEK